MTLNRTKDARAAQSVDQAVEAKHEQSVSTTPLALGLEEILRLLPQRELTAIVTAQKIRVDPAKRIDAPAQVARALLAMPEARDPERLPSAARQLMFRLVEAQGVLRVKALPTSVEPLVARGLVFARAAGGEVELLLPIAYMLQLGGWEGEDPRAIRRLLTQTSPTVAASIASHYLGTPATLPVSLSLEPAWRALVDSNSLRDALGALVPAERNLLRQIEEMGGEVDTEELLNLEKEPLRMRTAAGATPSRRGVGFALERRGYLVPVHPNRHVVPTEVVEIIGAERRHEAEVRRLRVRAEMSAEDYCPRTAQFAVPPCNLALAQAAHVRERRLEIKSDLGTPKSLLNRLASRFGQPAMRVALHAALSRALGLWEASARHAHSPPGKFSLDELNWRLFQVWREGGAWDEARPEGEVLRASGSAREQSVIGSVRAVVLEGLVELGEGRWIPWTAICEYVLSDRRAASLQRLLNRWAQRCAVASAEVELGLVARRIACESLHDLGCVDLGESEEDGHCSTYLRLTALGRACLSGAIRHSDRASEFGDVQTLRISRRTTVAQFLSLVPFVELGEVGRHLEVVVNASGVSSALAAGLDPSKITARLRAVAEIPAPVANLLQEASTVVGRVQLVPCAGFLWVDDPEVRRLLLARRGVSELFVDPSPPGGLLLAEGVDRDKVVRRCRTVGVAVCQTGTQLAVEFATRGTRREVGPDSESRIRSGTRRKSAAASSRKPKVG